MRTCLIPRGKGSFKNLNLHKSWQRETGASAQKKEDMEEYDIVISVLSTEMTSLSSPIL